LVVSVVCFTGGVFALVGRIFDNFGPAVQNDLDWKTVRGAQELAHTADLGLALDDAKIMTQAFGDYARVDDVVAIVALGSDGRVVATQGSPPEPPAQLVSGQSGVLRRAPGYLVACAPAVVEGNTVGRVAIVMSTNRLIQSRALLFRILLATAAAGAMALLSGLLFVNFFTRSIILRDRQLAEYATELEHKVAERTAELARKNAGLGLLLDNAAQGFVAVSLDGNMSGERSRILGEWLASPRRVLPSSTTCGPWTRARAGRSPGALGLSHCHSGRGWGPGARPRDAGGGAGRMAGQPIGRRPEQTSPPTTRRARWQGGRVPQRAASRSVVHDVDRDDVAGGGWGGRRARRS
jgi:hypothetical protein